MSYLNIDGDFMEKNETLKRRRLNNYKEVRIEKTFKKKTFSNRQSLINIDTYVVYCCELN